MKEENGLRILFVEDIPADYEMAINQIRSEGIKFNSLRTETKEEYIKALTEFMPDIVISDYSLPEFDGKTALKIILEFHPNIPFIILTGSINEITAVECIKAGASNYVLKEHLERLSLAIKDALEKNLINETKEKALQALKESEEKYRLLLENSGIGICVFNLDGTIQLLNQKALQNLGGKAEDYIGKTLIEVFGEEAGSVYLKRIHDTAKSEKSIEYEDFVVTASGSYWFLSNFTRITDSDGKIIGIQVLSHDITERKRVEEQLLLDHEIISSIYDGVNVVRCSDGIILFVNHRFENMFGYKQGELIGKHISIVNAPTEKNPQEIAKEIIDELNENNVWRNEILNIKKDGSTFWCDASITKMTLERSDYGDVWISVHSDISERKRNEEILNQTVYELKSLYDNLDEAIFSFDVINNKMLQVSASHKAIWGYPPEEFYKNPLLWYELIIAEDKPIIDSGYPVLASGKSIQHEVRIKRDGQIRWLEAKIKPTLNTNGALVHIDGIASDITERKNSEELLLSSQQITEGILNSIPVRVFWKDMNLVYLGCNKAFANDSGFDDPKDIIGKDDYQMGWNEQAEIYRFDDRLVIDSGKAKMNIEEPQTTPDGNIITLLTSKMPLKNSKGKINGLLGTYLDITDRKQAEIELIKAKEKAEESDKLKTAFLCNMSHEIRTPMNAIVGFSSFLKDPELSDEDKEQYCEIIEISANNLMNIIEDILSISKIDSGILTLKLEEINIKHFIELLCNEYKLKNKNELIEIKCTLGNDGKDIILNTDDNRLRQVLNNLINNALKFTKKGIIEIGYKLVQSSELGGQGQQNDVRSQQSTVHNKSQNPKLRTQNCIEFYVKDTGIGISEKNREIIFERFRQVENSSTRNYGGTGLGLAISKRIVETMGGNIWVESEPCKGSTFIFTLPYLPLKKESEIIAGKISKKEIIPDLSNVTILLAEDDEFNFKLFEIILNKTKAKLIRAVDGPQCIELFKQNKDIDIVLMDIQMPGMDGLEVTRILKKLRKDVPVIAQTAYAMENDRSRCLEAGCDDIITKPINTTKLLSLIEKYIR